MSFTLNRNIGHRGVRLSRRRASPPPHMSPVLGSGGNTNPFEGAASVGGLFHSSSSTATSTATTQKWNGCNQLPSRYGRGGVRPSTQQPTPLPRLNQATPHHQTFQNP